MRTPSDSEYADFYSTYVSKVPPGEVLEVLRGAPDALDGLLGGLTPAQQRFAYADGKWTLRELLGHVIDTERLFTYRALHIARNDGAELPGMDQEVWAGASNSGDRPLDELLAEFRALREADLRLFEFFDERALDRRGVASDCEFTVRALVYVTAGHELHHRGIVEDRYVPALAECFD